MQGEVGRRTTKMSVARSSKYQTNFYNIENIEILLEFGTNNGEYPKKRSINLSPGACWTLVTDENPGDIFSLSDFEQVLLEVGIDDVPEVTNIEEEYMVDGQQVELEVDGTGARALEDNHEETIGRENSDNTAIPSQQETERAPADPART